MSKSKVITFTNNMSTTESRSYGEPKKVYGVSNFKNLSFEIVSKHFTVPISIAALSLGV
jgi:predicted oxidoreductase